MKVTLFTAADYADTSTGKITIVGAFDNFQVEKCPCQFKPFSIAAKVLAEAEDKGREVEGRVAFRKVGAKKELFRIAIKLRFEMKSSDRVNSAAIAVNILGVTFESCGEYRLDFIAGSQRIASTPMKVVLSKSPAKP
jgi:hypothetical protein